MANINCDEYSMSNSVVPLLKDSCDNLTEAVNIISSISIPSGFDYSSELTNVSTKIKKSAENIGNVKQLILSIVSKFENAENENRNVLNELFDFGGWFDFDSNKQNTENLIDNTKNWLSNLWDDIKETGARIIDANYEAKLVEMEITQQQTANTVNATMAFGKGFAKIGETLLDAITIMSAFAADTGTFVAGEFIQHPPGMQVVSEELWDGIMEFTAENHVENAYKSIYEDTTVGKWLDQNANEVFKSTGVASEIASGLGEVAGIATIGAFTGGPFAVAGLSGAGKYTAEYWANARESSEDWTTEENREKGILYGTLNGIWESIQWGVGGNLDDLVIDGASEVANSVVRVGIDTIFNGLDTPFRAIVDSLTSDTSLQEAWEKQGGWTSVFTDVGIGLIGSIGGEIINSRKIDKGIAQINNEKFFEDVDESLVNQVRSNLMDKHLNGEIDLNNMSKSELKDYIHTEAANIKDNLRGIMKNSDFNKRNLIEGIADTIPKDLDDLTKARMVYLKLNQSVTYSDQYFAMNEFNRALYENELAEIYNRSLDISNLSTNSIICSNWSSIYADLLESVGIDSSKIEIMQAADYTGAHKWVKMDLGDGKILLADATNNITGMTDLANSKLGNRTGGFIITTPEEYAGLDAEYGSAATVFGMINSKKNPDIIKIDENIGYSNEQYMKDFETVLEMYGQVPEGLMPIEDKIIVFKDFIESNEYSSLDMFVMANKYAHEILGVGTDVHLYLKGDEAISVVEIWENNNVRYLYKVNDSKINITDNIQNIVEGALKRC